MGKIGLAFRAFFRVLMNQQTAEQVERLFRDGALPKDSAPAPMSSSPPTAPKPAKPSRSEALTLLSTLQREARLLDLLKEPLQQYSDQEVGAAARDVLRNCGSVLERLFDLQPVMTQQEGDQIVVPAGFDAAKYRLTGNLTGEPPFKGTLTHHGWKAQHCQLPEWSGSSEAVLVVSPAEVELK